MAKIIIDTDELKSIIHEYHYGYLIEEMIAEIIASGKELVYCEDCDMSYFCFSPFDQKNYVRCTYNCTGDGKVVCRHHYCSAGERRKDNACE